MSEIAEKPKRIERSYTEAEIRRALVEVAACSGNTHLAARRLAEDDNAPSITKHVLWEWSRRRHVETYEQLRAEQLPAINAQAAEEHMALVRQQLGGAQKLTAELIAESSQLEPKDKVNALGKFDIGSGIHTEKAQLLAGLPTARVERDTSEVLRKLQSRGVVVEAEVVGEEDLGDSGSGLAVAALPADSTP